MSLVDQTIDGDTTKEKDLVTKQYENLPYPEVSEDEMLLEEAYFKKGNTGPLVLFSGLTLETMNHYLFQGGENFQ